MTNEAYIEEEQAVVPQGTQAAAPAMGRLSPAAAEALSAGSAAASVMVLLDDVANAGLMSACLEALGYRNVVVAEHPAAARQMLLNDQPDMLLLDADLPGEGGLELLAWMRSDKSLKDTPVIVLADLNGMDLKLRALELGATDCLAKPVDARELALRMRNTLALALTARRSGAEEQDGLTGLTNRQRFNTVLEWALTYA